MCHSVFTGRWISVSCQLGGLVCTGSSPFFSEPIRFCVGFRTWLIFAEAIGHTGESSRNRGLILFTILRSVWNETDIRLVPNRSEVSRGFLCFKRIFLGYRMFLGNLMFNRMFLGNLMFNRMFLRN